MIVFRFPPEARSERAAFTVVGTEYPGGALADEMMLVPEAAMPESGFSGCIYYLDEQRPLHLPICPQTLIPQALAERFPGNPVCISPALCGRTLEAQLQEAVSRAAAPLWLIVRPLSHFFMLPCPSGVGRFMPKEEAVCLTRLDVPVFSRALCCEYCRAEYSGVKGLYLFDTAQSTEEKLRLADKAGIRHVLILPPGAQ